MYKKGFKSFIVYVEFLENPFRLSWKSEHLGSISVQIIKNIFIVQILMDFTVAIEHPVFSLVIAS